VTQLATEISDLNAELDVFLAGDQNRVVIKEIVTAYEDLDLSFTALESTLKERDVLRTFPELFSFDVSREQEEGALSGVAAKYAAAREVWEGNRAEIRQSGSVGDLVDALNEYRNLLAASNKRAWVNWVNSTSREFAVTDAELESVMAVPDYKQPIAIYVRARENFITLSGAVPTRAIEVETLLKIAGDLSQIKGHLEFRLPKFVLHFYNTLDREGSFPLDQLDQKLLEWLEEKDELKNLSIRRRGIARF
jgi:hypothetical protein